MIEGTSAWVRAVLASATLTAILISGCATVPEPPRPTAPSSELAGSSAIASAHGMAGMSVREMIDHLERMPVAQRPGDLRASVRPGELKLSNGSSEEALPMPDDAFYLSVAPFIQQTHKCFFRSLTTCLGELRGKQMRVKITGSDGLVVRDEAITAADNGFVGVWLPRGIKATLRVDYEGKSVEAPIGTSDADPTCLTTLQLR